LVNSAGDYVDGKLGSALDVAGIASLLSTEIVGVCA
jgi:hypothetical protein